MRYFFLLLLMGILGVLSFFACKSIESRPVRVPKDFDWQGHRGSRGLVPENTVPSFLKALEFPEVTTLELDLAVSKDNQLIVSHEPWFNPAICSRPDGSLIAKAEAEGILLYQLTAEEIRAYDCGKMGNPRFPQQVKIAVYKPTLREVVAAVRAVKPGIRWNIEIKSHPDWDGLRHPPVADFVRMVVDEVRALGLEKTATVQSFDVRALQELHRQAPDLTLAYLIENTQGFDYNMVRLGFKPAIYSPYYLLVDKQLVRQCHKNGIKLIPWTVNEVRAMRDLLRLGVDGIITDYPDRIRLVY